MNHRAPLLPPSGRWVSPQGRPEQGWPARRCSSEPETVVIDRLPEDYDPREVATGMDVAVCIVGFIVSCAFAAWACIVFADQLKPLLVALLAWVASLDFFFPLG